MVETHDKSFHWISRKENQSNHIYNTNKREPIAVSGYVYKRPISALLFTIHHPMKMQPCQHTNLANLPGC